MSARYSAADYAQAARSLLPRGRVWPAAPDSVQGKVLAAVGRTFERSDAAAVDLLNGSVPGSGAVLLAAWESTLGLSGVGTDEQRLKAVRGRFIRTGGQSRGDYTAFAEQLGFTITITPFRAPRAGESLAGPPYPPEAWPFCWGVRVMANAGTLSADQLIAELDAIKPAETIVFLLT